MRSGTVKWFNTEKGTGSSYRMMVDAMCSCISLRSTARGW